MRFRNSFSSNMINNKSYSQTYHISCLLDYIKELNKILDNKITRSYNSKSN